MKKFFTLICAIAIAFSASAAQIAPKAELVKKAPVVVEQMQKVQIEKAQFANFNQLSATPAMKVINQEAKAPAVKPAARKLATGEPIVVIIDGAPSIQPAGDMQAITVTGKDNMIYAWGVKTTSLEAGKTYAFTDMNTDFTYRCSQDYFTTYEDPTDATFSIDAENNITASIVTESGTYMVYTKAPQPEPVEITLVADTLDFFTKMLSAGYYIVRGYNVDSTYEFSFYFNSKSITGNFTEEDFYTYDTWVDEKDGKKIVVSYQNLSAANVTVSLVKDTLYYTGTMTLATNDGQEANITLNLSCPYKQEWGEWEDFAPFGLNTGKYTLNAVFDSAVVKNVPVKERKDNTGLKQYQFLNLGKGYYGTDGINMTINMNANRICTIKPVMATVKTSATTTMNIILTDAYTATGAADYAEASYYDPEEGTFNLFVVAFNETASQIITAANETMVMDKPITERDTVYVNSKTLSSFYEESIKGYVYQSSNTDYKLIQIVTNSSEQLGTFTAANINFNYSALSADGKTSYIYFQDGEITVSEDPEGFKLIGLMIGEDEKAYVFNLIQPASVLEYDTDAPFDATFAYNEMDASIKDGVISISLQKGTEFAMELELYADPAATTIPEGTYTISDSKEASTALQSTGYGEQGPAACYAATLVVQQSKLYLDDMWFLVEGTITLSYDEYGKLKVVVDGKNSYGQPVTALVKYEKLEPKSVVTIEADNMKFTGAGTMFLLDAANTNYEVVLMVTSTDTAGTYGVEDLVATYSAIYSADGSQVSILDGEFTLALNGKEMTLTGSLLASDTIQYDLSLTGYMGALVYDSNSDLETSFDLDDATIQTQKVGTSPAIVLQVANGQYVFAIAFIAELDSEGNIPAGTYTIDNTKAAGTVLASSGYSPQYGPGASFVGEINGTQYTGFWFLEGGTVKVDENGDILVEAVNSLDKNVKVTVTPGATGLFRINAIAPKLNKIMLNGHVVIFKNNKAYNLMGAEL